jgi:hypothetical protein
MKFLRRGGIKTRGGDHTMSGAYPHFKPSYAHEELVEHFAGRRQAVAEHLLVARNFLEERSPPQRPRLLGRGSVPDSPAVSAVNVNQWRDLVI